MRYSGGWGLPTIKQGLGRGGGGSARGSRLEARPGSLPFLALCCPESRVVSILGTQWGGCYAPPRLY